MLNALKTAQVVRCDVLVRGDGYSDERSHGRFTDAPTDVLTMRQKLTAVADS